MDVWGPATRKWCTVALIASSFTLGLGSAIVAYRKHRRAASRQAVLSDRVIESGVSETQNMATSTESEQLAQQQASACGLEASIRQLSMSDTAAAPVADRDSANHSPSDFLSGNNIHSDAHSESSNDNDSGKGGSDCAANNHLDSGRFDVMTPPLSPAHGVVECSSDSHLHGSHMHSHHMAPLPERLFVYEFEIPQLLCGLLIGRFGAFVNHIRVKTGAHLIVKKHPSNKRVKQCAIEGTKSEIDSALELIREKFPPKRYPQVTLAQTNISTTPTAVPVLPDSIQLHLPAEVSCDVIVSAVVAPNHIFVQQVTHPTYSSLARLDMYMAMCYNEFETPMLPRPIQPSMICAAPSLGGWYRAKVVAVHPAVPSSVGEFSAGHADDKNEAEEEEVGGIGEDCDLMDQQVDICFVDYGGYARVPASSLRQIRADFMTLPFQAVECLLANVAPHSDEEGWSLEAYTQLEAMTCDRMLQVQVVAYSLEGPPLIYLYQTPDATGATASSDDQGAILINRQLVSRGVALWVEPQLVPSDLN